MAPVASDERTAPLPRLVADLTYSARAVGTVFANPGLRRLEIGWGSFISADHVSIVALSLVAYEVAGAGGVGGYLLARMLPAAVAVPFSAVLGDRMRRETVMVAVQLLRAAAIAGVLVAVRADAAMSIIYVIVALDAIIISSYRPMQWALPPVLARTPTELGAVNTSSAFVEGIGTLAGPALAGVLVALQGIESALIAAIVLSVLGALSVGKIHSDRTVLELHHEPVGAALLGGFRSIRTNPAARLLIGLFGAQTFVRGLLYVLIVVAAIDLLALGEAGVGYLNAAIGAGCLLGVIVTVGLIGRRLGVTIAAALVLWGAPIALIGIHPQLVLVLVALTLIGIGNTLLDVAGLTLIQRVVANHVLTRVFGVLESLAMTTMALGGLAAPILVDALGVRGAHVAAGAVLPVAAVVSFRRLRAAEAATDSHEREVRLLRGIPMFRPLSLAAVEHLARSLRPVTVTAGEPVIVEGEVGDRFYVITGGTVEVTVRGERVCEQGAGEHFGEIALVESRPRTATVTALTDVELLALEKQDFLAAVLGHAESHDAAQAVVLERLRTT